MTDFLLELLSEEIPARMQAKARADLERLLVEMLAADGLTAGCIRTYSTPRRLALIAEGLPLKTEAIRHETKGPKVGAHDQAIEGFLRRYLAAREDLVERNGVYFLDRMAAGRPTTRVLQDAVEEIIRAFPWPKSMRWGDRSVSTESLRWVRPLQGIVAILGEELVSCQIDGIASGYATVGHRFHHNGPITIGNAHDYAEKLRACHVIVDQTEREAMVRDGAKAAAEAAGLALVEDEGLVIENAGLTEWPVPLLGRFDAEFLEVPPEVIQLTARINQKYFICRNGAGQLANAFICTANIAAHDGGAAIVAGNAKVLAARLSDARFFYDTDRKTPLAVHAEKLKDVVFHEKLGTVADKVERVAKLARWLVESGVIQSSPDRGGEPRSGGGAPAPYSDVTITPHLPLHHPADGPPPPVGEELANLAEQAARLCKADLVTGMVGEFPELQGIMGGYYARAEGLDPQVAHAIRDHYKPVGQGDEVPTAPVTVAVSLADKLDTLVGFFYADMPPTGSKDPFALRRAALAVLELLTRNYLRLSVWEGIARALACLTRQHCSPEMSDAAAEKHQAGQALAFANLPNFLADRLKVQQREAGVRHDLIDAVFALGGEEDFVRLLARVHALQAFVATPDGTNLLGGYKRAANILKKEGWPGHAPAMAGPGDQDIPQTGEEDPMVLADDPALAAAMAEFANIPSAPQRLSYTPEKAEADLIAALDAAEPAADAAIAAEDFTAAMAALALLRVPIDRFFEDVTVNDADPAKRTARLALLVRVRDAVHRVADFSKIEG